MILKLKVLRTNKNLSQNALARRSGVPQRNISYWESRNGDPPISACVALCKVLEVSLNELIITENE